MDTSLAPIRDLEELKACILDLFGRNDIELIDGNSYQTSFMVEGDMRAIHEELLQKTNAAHWRDIDGVELGYDNPSRDVSLYIREVAGIVFVVGSISSRLRAYCDAVARGDDPDTWPR